MVSALLLPSSLTTLSRALILVWNPGLNRSPFVPGNSLANFDQLPFICWVVRAARFSAKLDHSLAKVRYADFVGDLNEDIPFPFAGVDEIADWKWDVGCVVGCVLVEDDVAPSLVEISGGHGARCCGTTVPC